MDQVKGTIGRWQGAGLMATTLLGTGVFILPQMTIAIAGTGALIAWLLLTLAIIPVTLVFGRLAGVFPHAAGPAYFVEKAFGRTAGRTIGLIFLFVVPLGAPAAILMTFQFVDALIPLSGWSQVAVQLSFLVALFLLNFRGIHVSAKLQFALTLAIVSVVVLMFGAGGLNLDKLQLLSHGTTTDSGLIMAAAGIAFWSFVGVEAMTHLANDFKDPKKDMLPAMMIGTVLVGLVYLACTGLLLLMQVETVTGLAMVTAFDNLLGGYGVQVIAILGIAGGLATVNVYTASVSRLIWSFSKEGILPRYFDSLNQHQVPVRALSVVLLAMAVVIVLTYVSGQELEQLIAWTNGVFVIIYLASMLAAAKLLSKRYLPLIGLGSTFCIVLGFALGWNMLYALVMTLVVAPFLWWQKNHLGRKQKFQVA
ncbi:L-methionine/branched-chain amino acid transporter [Shewanella eurypsychrophilus]|uniref:L-methionine/branched-chain amino acid transporter n=1 Tax=Shewanella eurypsychrophilus TaxID=2593656 RepID=A0ABX6V317_9GAMM|nr:MULTISPECIES: L-methionine/branched-chain amino acid transporter [Shewanella]QFU20643.1 L-methionine/branched-chain amino acid transporter [Shewanella sp. YLB-09]QFU20923.1 L-methionine/branched-chain amino acid transporter [Shewanella sp. YLB-09]QPG56211.1 L-methionine/branched-chain amino acid transporter [Shewanella eurypsychrophilus]